MRNEPMLTCLKRLLILGLCWLSLVACRSNVPPLEFAPDGAIVQQAIAFELDQTQTALSRNLNASPPDFKVSQINVKNIEAIVVNRLPTYHLTGTYHLKLMLPRQTVKQANNPFEVYLQRQQEGESWRLLRRDIDPRTQKPHWTTYLIAPTIESST